MQPRPVPLSFILLEATGKGGILLSPGSLILQLAEALTLREVDLIRGFQSLGHTPRLHDLSNLATLSLNFLISKVGADKRSRLQDCCMVVMAHLKYLDVSCN